MLDDYKELYKQSASLIPETLKMDKNELARLCIKNENTPEYSIYLSALLYRYWGLISKFYAMSTNLAEPEDCYSWLVDAIMYALKHRQWENPESTIYNDPKGPDKVINRCMKSSRLIFYQFQNRKKRRKEYQLISIEGLKEELNADSIDLEDDSSAINEFEIDMIFNISQIFRKKEYFLAFILDCICNESVFDAIDDKITFNIKHLVKKFKAIDDTYLKLFSQKYDLNLDEVYQAAILAKNIPDSKIRLKIEDTLLRLKHSDLIKGIIRS